MTKIMDPHEPAACGRSRPSSSGAPSALERLLAEEIKAANACHDWLIAHPDHFGPAPAELNDRLIAAEEAIQAHRRRESDRYFAACREGRA